MARTQAPNLRRRTAHSGPYVELKQSVRSQIRAISRSVAEVVRFMRNFRKGDGSESEIETALREALENAVVHGNGWEPGKRVYVDCRCYMDGDISITVRDEGRGFDTNALPDPTAPDKRLLPHGRGIYLMKSLMDEVSFEEGGTVVHMRKASTAAAAPSREAESGGRSERVMSTATSWRRAVRT